MNPYYDEDVDLLSKLVRRSRVAQRLTAIAKTEAQVRANGANWAARKIVRLTHRAYTAESELGRVREHWAELLDSEHDGLARSVLGLGIGERPC